MTSQTKNSTQNTSEIKGKVSPIKNEVNNPKDKTMEKNYISVNEETHSEKNQDMNGENVEGNNIAEKNEKRQNPPERTEESEILFWTPEKMFKSLHLKVVRNLGVTVKDFYRAFPYPIDLATTMEYFLESVYRLDRYILMGTKNTVYPRTVKEWRESMEVGIFKYFQPNPVNGKLGRLQSGELSYRAPECITKYWTAVLKFDKLNYEEQLAMAMSIISDGGSYAKMTCAPNAINKVLAVIEDSENVHILYRADGSSKEGWDAQFKRGFTGHMLLGYGANPCFMDETALAFVPNHNRHEDGAYQRLIYLNPNAGGDTEGVSEF